MSFSPSFDSSYIDRLKEISDVDKKGNNIKSQEKPAPEVVLWELDQTRMAQASAADKQKVQTLYDKGIESKKDFQKKLTASRPTVGKVKREQSEMEAVNDSLEGRRLGMTATGSTFGNIWLRAKSNVSVSGVGKRFDGDWYVSNVTHKIDGSGYRTDFKCVR